MENRYLKLSLFFLFLFCLLTIGTQNIDLQYVKETDTIVGFATINFWFHQFIGVHLWIYKITDYLSIVPVLVCVFFSALGFFQLITRKNLFFVDHDLLLLGFSYCGVLFCYSIFELIPINYRPILIESRLEASYPSSTTLLVLCVMSSALIQIKLRIKQKQVAKKLSIFVVIYSLMMILGRTLSGVHWLTDILGAVLLSCCIIYLYYFAVLSTKQ